MRAAHVLLLLGVVLLACMPRTSMRAQEPNVSLEPRPHFRTAVRLTTVNVTVTDADGRLVRDLPRERFEVFEDGEPQPLTQFTSDRVPVSLGVLLDASDSMHGRRIVEARGAIEHFVTDLLASSDEYALIAFNHQQQLLADWTADRALAPAMLSSIRPWGATAIYDALMTAIPMAATRHNERAALLVVSDGADTASDTGLRDLRSALLRSDVFVYAIGIDSADRRAINAPVNASTLAQITDQSGGSTRVVHDMSEVRSALERIAEELNSQYLMGYNSPRGADGKYHSIRVRVKGGGFRIRARNGYIG